MSQEGQSQAQHPHPSPAALLGPTPPIRSLFSVSARHGAIARVSGLCLRGWAEGWRLRPAEQKCEMAIISG